MKRRACILALGLAGAAYLFFAAHPPDPLFQERPVSSWIHDIVDSRSENHQAGLNALPELGEPAATHLAKFLPYTAAETRWLPAEWDEKAARLGFDRETPSLRRANALTALARLGPRAAPALPELIELLGDAPEELLPEVTFVLRRSGRSASHALCRALRANSESTRARAAKTLQDFAPSPDIRNSLVRSLGDRSPIVRANALESLGILGATELAPILRALEDQDHRVRAKACEALGNSRAIEAAARLRQMFADASSGVQFEAARAVWKLTRDAGSTLPVFIRLLKTAESWRSAYALAEMRDGAAPAVPALVAAMGRERVPRPFRSPASATFALGQIPAAVPALLDALNNERASLRMNALLALGMLGPAAAPSVDRLLPSLDDPEPDVRVAAALTLGMAGARDEQTVAGLENCLHADDIFLRSRALHLLRKVAPDREWAATSE